MLTRLRQERIEVEKISKKLSIDTYPAAKLEILAQLTLAKLYALRGNQTFSLGMLMKALQRNKEYRAESECSLIYCNDVKSKCIDALKFIICDKQLKTKRFTDNDIYQILSIIDTILSHSNGDNEKNSISVLRSSLVAFYFSV